MLVAASVLTWSGAARADVPAQQDLVADHHRRDDVGILLGETDDDRNLVEVFQAVAAEPLVQRLEVNLGMRERHDKEQAVLLVLEEQVLGVPAGQLAFQA